MAEGAALWREIGAILAGAKRHAGFFHGPTKHATEANVLRCFLAAAGTAGLQIRSARLEGLERPDAELTLTDGRRVGLEITEFVDEGCRAAAERARDDPMAAWRPCDVAWTPRAIRGLLADRLASKSAKIHAPERFDAWWVLVFTDEPGLDPAMIDRALSEAALPAPGIDRALMLMSHGTADRCPLFDLPLGDRP
ncbi:MAG: hypothetical protein AAGC57_06735 [Pseudomonadota bacterium]